MTRAVAQTLARAWNAEIDFGRIGDAKPGRIHDLALIEDRVKAQLPQAILMPRALRDLALTRMQCSRHWHDLVRLNDASYAREAFDDRGLAKEVAEFKGKFFRARDSKGNPIDYVAAVAGALQLVPDAAILKTLEADYKKMADDGILLGDAEPFADLIKRCADLERRANAKAKEA